ncbi:MULTISPECIES: MFS transporter [Glycomyces]|uniref:MFS family arabinose efflux permease n=2 Tax=Glycomyces TaxID=58113 RepID=A0A9X3PIM4_9ACTN|nr:MFS transporter [Glycomyces lechevalierae]MDA1386211.1 MFS transporter [Glycomyces lechevalierae]MDR7338315.1 putative MFS family arabinose efflux permease [Glycomyces lechevalierae]
MTEAPPKPAPKSMFRNPDYRKIFVSVGASQIGLQVAYFSISIIAVVVLDLSESQIGVLYAMDQIALVMFGLLVGVWVDRLRDKPIIVTSEILRAVVMVSVPVAWALDALATWHVFAAMFLLGLTSVFFDVAQSSYVPRLIDNKRLASGNSRIQGIRSASDTGGPLAAGPLVSLLTAPVAIVVAVVSFAVSAFSVARIQYREEEPERPEKPHLGAEVVQGVKFIFRDSMLRSILLVSAWCNLSVGAFQAMLMVFLIREADQSSEVAGFVLAGSGVGGVLGAMLVGRISKKAGVGPTAIAALALSGPGMAIVAASGPGWGAAVAFVGQVVYVAAIVVFNVNVISYRQAVTPDDMQGRVGATQRVICWAGLAVGSIVGGFTGDLFSARTALLIAAAMLFAGSLPLLRTPLRKLKEIPEEGALAS